jgi:hypothetical protein
MNAPLATGDNVRPGVWILVVIGIVSVIPLAFSVWLVASLLWTGIRHGFLLFRFGETLFCIGWLSLVVFFFFLLSQWILFPNT